MEKNINRRLCAIMFTDMAGFTELMQRDEAAGLQMRNRHKEVFQLQHKKFKGEIIQYFGDGTLSIFDNSNAAIECAIEMQKALHEPIQVPIRIGIHVGNILVEKDGIIGDAVNIASRIESFANIGGVFISDAVQDQVKNQTQWGFVNLGKFNLKNVDRNFEIYALSADGLSVPDPDSLKGKGEKVASLKSHIPEPFTPILGREKEIHDLITLLGVKQVVTITGTGGMGKTRLSLEICHRLKSQFQHGMAFVSMATLSDAKEVIPTLAEALDVKEAAGRELINGVAALISDQKALLVLDNLEHVISASMEISELANQCPNLKILCTSRTPLKIKVEQEYALQPLPLPEKINGLNLTSYPSIQLFIDRAKHVNMDFELTDENAISVVEICRRMDGLPLALELAAARIRILPPDKLLDRLGRALDVLTSGSSDLPLRHRTLRATIDWSYSLLKENEKRLFRRCSVFAGGFTLEAVEAVCYMEAEDELSAMDELEALVNMGLVENLDGGQRFNLLQTISDFAIEKLGELEEVDTFLKNHSDFYLEFCGNIEKGIAGDNQIESMKACSLEDSNIQEALDYLLDKAQSGDEIAKEKGLLLCGTLWEYWHIRGKHNSAKNYINSFFEATSDRTPSLGKCKALLTLSVALFTLGEYDACRDQSLLHNKYANQLNNEIEIAKSTFNASFGYFTFDLIKAKEYSDETVSLFKVLSEPYWLALSLWQNGIMNLAGGNFPAAKEIYAESVEIFTKLNDFEGKGGSLSGLAMIEVINGNHQNALEIYRQALSAFERVGDRPEEARILSEMSWVFLAQKNTQKAQIYTLDSIQAYQEVGSIRGVGISMFGLAAIEAVEGRPENAIIIAAAAEQFAKQEGIVVEFGLNNQGKVYLQSAKNELSENAIKEAEEAGSKLSLKDVLQMVEFEAVLI